MGLMIIAVLVGFGVRVAVGRIIGGRVSSGLVGVLDGIKGVRVRVGDAVGDAV